MQCGEFYFKEYSVPNGDSVWEINEISQDSEFFYPEKGIYYVYKIPEPKKFSYCFEVSGKHYHGIVKSSSELKANQGLGYYFYALQGEFRVPSSLCKKLKVKIGDKIAVKKEKIEKAKSLVLKPLFTDQPKPKIPKIIGIDMEIFESYKSNSEIYGSIFSQLLPWKVTEINGLKVSNKLMKFSRSHTKVSFLPAEGRLLPKNLYKSVSPSGVFTKLSSIKSALTKLLTIRGRKCGIWVHSRRGCGKRALIHKFASKCGYTCIEVSMFNYTVLKDFEELLKNQKLFSVLHVRQFPESIDLMTTGQQEVLLKLRDIIREYLEAGSDQFIVFSTSDSLQVPSVIRNLLITVDLPVPNSKDRETVFGALGIVPDQSLLLSTSGKSIDELSEISKYLKKGMQIDEILQKFKVTGTGIPNVKWEDVGGLIEAKQEIIDTIQLPLLHPEYFKLKPRSGLLLYGPPGTGKTLLAKAIATECSLNFLPVKGPELLNMYVGESERNIRELFEKARSLQPCVLFFDELDSLAPKRGQGSDSGVMDRIVAQLLTEIDGLQTNSTLFVIGATNRPDLLDSALLRPGRFDKMIYLGIPSDKESKLKIFQALTRKFVMDGVNLNEICQKLEGCYSGADIYAVCSQALSLAYSEKAIEIEERVKLWNESVYYEEPINVEGYLNKNKGVEIVEVKQKHFLKAIQEISPSLSEQEIAKYKHIGK